MRTKFSVHFSIEKQKKKKYLKINEINDLEQHSVERILSWMILNWPTY